MNESNEPKPQVEPGSNRRAPASDPATMDIPRPPGRRILIYAAVAVGIFLLGFVPMGFKAASNAKERDAVRQELQVAHVQLRLASALVDASRGEYEPARLAAVDFFTDLSAELRRGDDSNVSREQRDALRPILEQRDEIITLLARSDPASAERLSEMYVTYRNAIGR